MQSTDSEEEQRKLVALVRSELSPSVDLQLKQGGEEGLTDALLFRWLKAEGYDVQKAATRLQSHAAWRVQAVPEGAIKEAEIQAELADPKQVFLQGYDKQHRPFAVYKGGLRSKETRNYAITERAAMYVMDTFAEACLDHPASSGKCCILVDMSEVTLAKMDPKLRQTIFTVLEQHYPERLGFAIMYGAPLWLRAIWWVASPWVGASTKGKFTFMSTPAEVLQHVDAEVLPKAYGGNAELVPVDEWVKNRRAAKAAHAQQGVEVVVTTPSA